MGVHIPRVTRPLLLSDAHAAPRISLSVTAAFSPLVSHFPSSCTLYKSNISIIKAESEPTRDEASRENGNSDAVAAAGPRGREGGAGEGRNFRQSDFLRAIGGGDGGGGGGGGGDGKFMTLRDLPLVAPGRYVADDIENSRRENIAVRDHVE